MTTYSRTRRTLALVAALLLAPTISHADLIIDGELTEDDFLAIDSVGGFYYDIIEFVASDNGPISISLDSADFAPYLAWGTGIVIPPWPTGSNDPYATFEDQFCLDDPGGSSLNIGSASAGQSFQVMVATCYYNPTPLGDYTFVTDGDVSRVPEPGTLLLFGLGLIGMAATSRRQRAA